jgi:hypothetical protein
MSRGAFGATLDEAPRHFSLETVTIDLLRIVTTQRTISPNSHERMNSIGKKRRNPEWPSLSEWSGLLT